MLSNKIKGCLFGYAIGDALGLGTEFMTRWEAEIRYPEGLTTYSDIIRDAHRLNWERGQFSHDTDFVLLMADSMAECRGLDYSDYARRIKNWFDKCISPDIGNNLRWILQKEAYASEPLKLSQATYEAQGHFEAWNEALGRAVIAGLWPEFDEQKIIDNTRLTHWDNLSVACSVIIAIMANELLWHRREADFDRLIGLASRFDPRLLPYIETARNGDISDFTLDDEAYIWSAPKSVGAALWALWHFSDPGDALYRIIAEGGDADTTGALTMALMGLKYGYNRLPQHLIDNLLGKERIQHSTSRLIQVIEKDADNLLKDTDE